VRRIGTGLLILLLHLTAFSRPVQVTVWISGGTRGILAAGSEAPGQLGVTEHLRQSPYRGFWIDVGGFHTDKIENSPPQPDIVIPDLTLLQSYGLKAFDSAPQIWTALNAGTLPQYPEFDKPFPSRRTLQHPDGPEITVIGLLAKDSPLRVAPPLLRPLKILPPEESLKSFMTDLRTTSAFPIVILPEHTNPADWSRLFPEVPLFVEPASANPAVIPLEDGKRLRVRPGLNGRAVIRVTLVWDTVDRTFSAPSADIEWVRNPDLSGFALSPDARKRLTLLRSPPELQTLQESLSLRLLEKGDADTALLPRIPSTPPPHPLLPESWRVHLFPEDFRWVRISIDAETHRRLRSETPAGHSWAGRQSGPVRLLLPAPLSAGSGGGSLEFRESMDTSRTPPRLLPFTARDLIFP
jgi:hypothetical protein